MSSDIFSLGQHVILPAGLQTADTKSLSFMMGQQFDSHFLLATCRDVCRQDTLQRGLKGESSTRHTHNISSFFWTSGGFSLCPLLRILLYAQGVIFSHCSAIRENLLKIIEQLQTSKIWPEFIKVNGDFPSLILEPLSCQGLKKC